MIPTLSWNECTDIGIALVQNWYLSKNLEGRSCTPHNGETFRMCDDYHPLSSFRPQLHFWGYQNLIGYPIPPIMMI